MQDGGIGYSEGAAAFLLVTADGLSIGLRRSLGLGGVVGTARVVVPGAAVCLVECMGTHSTSLGLSPYKNK